MATTLRPVGHEDRLSLVEHLDELRSRLIICISVFVVAFAVCIWQGDALLKIVNQPLEHATSTTANATGGGRLEQTARFQVKLREALQATAQSLRVVARTDEGLSPASRAALIRAANAQAAAVKDLPRTVPERQPVTLGVGEPFTTTLTVSAWFALLLSLPVILYQLYAFILPAFTPSERKVATPLLLMVPLLFICGVVFGYFVVVPPAIRFLQNFNDSSFDILVQARDYYKFVIMALVGMGILFQIPVGILALTRLGIVTPRQLRKNRRYALLIVAVVAMLLPGTDPITMLISMVPLLVLFEGSIILASVLDRRRSADDEEDDEAELDLGDDELPDLPPLPDDEFPPEPDPDARTTHD
jgi:sec-independent protein translocase protein TatC